MGLPTADTCCCCCGLRLGSIIIGVLTLVSSLYCLFQPMEGGMHGIDDVVKDSEASKITLIVFYVIWAVLAVVLVAGVFMGNRVMVVLYAWGLFIETFVEVIFIVAVSFLTGIYWFLLILIILLLPMYFAWVVFSYAQEMERGPSSMA